MRVLVCGGRDFRDYDLMRATLDPLFVDRSLDWFIIIQGGAAGADQLAREWCNNRGAQSWTFKADWKKYGRAAGPIRNAEMVAQAAPNLVLAFPGGRGTADMVRRARAAGIPVREIGGGS